MMSDYSQRGCWVVLCFVRVVALAIKVLVLNLQTKVDVAFSQMLKMPWASWESVGDQSEYVNQFHTYVSQSVPLYNDWLSAIHFRYFCDSFIE